MNGGISTKSRSETSTVDNGWSNVGLFGVFDGHGGFQVQCHSDLLWWAFLHFFQVAKFCERSCLNMFVGNGNIDVPCISHLVVWFFEFCNARLQVTYLKLSHPGMVWRCEDMWSAKGSKGRKVKVFLFFASRPSFQHIRRVLRGCGKKKTQTKHRRVQGTAMSEAAGELGGTTGTMHMFHVRSSHVPTFRVLFRNMEQRHCRKITKIFFSFCGGFKRFWEETVLGQQSYAAYKYSQPRIPTVSRLLSLLVHVGAVTYHRPEFVEMDQLLKACSLGCRRETEQMTEFWPYPSCKIYAAIKYVVPLLYSVNANTDYHSSSLIIFPTSIHIHTKNAPASRTKSEHFLTSFVEMCSTWRYVGIPQAVNACIWFWIVC